MNPIIKKHYNTDIERSRDAETTRHDFEVVVKECLSHLTNKLIEEVKDVLHLEQDLNITPCDMDEVMTVIAEKFDCEIEIKEPQTLTVGELIDALFDNYKGRFDSAQRPNKYPHNRGIKIIHI